MLISTTSSFVTTSLYGPSYLWSQRGRWLHVAVWRVSALWMIVTHDYRACAVQILLLTYSLTYSECTPCHTLHKRGKSHTDGLMETRGPIYKISYDNLTIILR